MSLRGNPTDHAKTESFMKTLKSEQIHRQHETLAQVSNSVGEWIDELYNKHQPLAAIGIAILSVSRVQTESALG